MNTYMKMSAKEQDHREFLNSLRERLNVDDKTIANLEKRITGKFYFHLPAPPVFLSKVGIFAFGGAWVLKTRRVAAAGFFRKLCFLGKRFPQGMRDRCHGPNQTRDHFQK